MSMQIMSGHLVWGLMEEEGWRKGPWTAEEDRQLIEYVKLHGEGRWNSVARVAGLRRNGKSCRLRWVNYLRPDLKRGQITPQEENIILELHAKWGNRWSTIARSLPGRTDNEIKNYWRTHFKKKVKAPSDAVEKAKTRLLRRQQFLLQQQRHQELQQQQQQQQALQVHQFNQMDVRGVIALLDDNEEHEAPCFSLPRQDMSSTSTMLPCSSTSTDQEQQQQQHGYFLSMLQGSASLPETLNHEDMNMWDGLWNLDDIHTSAFSGAFAATSKASPHHLVAPFC